MALETDGELGQEDARRLAAIVASSEDAIVSIDANGTIISWNRGAERLFGYPAAEAVGRHFGLIAEPGLTAEQQGILDRVLRGERVASYETTRRHRSGEAIDVSITISAVRDAENHVVAGSAIIRDVRERKAAERALAMHTAYQDVLLELGRTALAGNELSAVFGEACSSVARALRLDHAAILLGPGNPQESSEAAARGDGDWRLAATSHLAPDHPLMVALASSDARLSRTVSEGQPRAVADIAGDPDSVGLSAHAIASALSVPIHPDDESSVGVLELLCMTARSFSDEEIKFAESVANMLATAIQRKASEDAIRHRAIYDPLTGLANRALFHDRLDRALARPATRDSGLAVLVLGLLRFTWVADTLGSQAADELLELVARRLRDAVGPADTVARLGGDEFAILCDGCGSERDAIASAERINEAFARPFMLSGHRFFAAASIGIVVIDESTGGAETVVRDARTAMHGRKSRGDAGYELFDERLRARMVEWLRIEDGLRQALERDELELYYQPVIDTQTGEILALEALLRWERPQEGLWLPEQFLPVAERSGLLGPISRWVLEHACRDVARWSPSGPGGSLPMISVNVPATQVAGEGFVLSLADMLARSGVDPCQLAIEVTESALMRTATGAAQQSLRELRQLGIAIWLDDFGTGQSSLAFLQRLDLDALKIDKSFVAGIARERDQRIVEAVLAMGRALDLRVVAEGVESVDQLTNLHELGCRAAQGYLFASPLPAGSIPRLLEDGIDSAIRARLLRRRDLAPRGDGPRLAGSAEASPVDGTVHPLATITMGEAAHMLGISMSTLRRWADGGHVTVVRTAGGHRRFPADEIRQLAARSAAVRNTSMRGADLPARPLPTLAELLRAEGTEIAATAARSLYRNQDTVGWFASPEAADAASRLLETMSSAAVRGEYEPAMSAAVEFIQLGERAGASVLERHTYLERLSELLVRTLAARSVARDEVLAAGRLMVAIRQAHLQTVA